MLGVARHAQHVEFLRFCGLGCDEYNDSYEQQQNRSPLGAGV
jgi:hypothetical protein